MLRRTCLTLLAGGVSLLAQNGDPRSATIHEGDLLQITVAREQDFTRRVAVKDDGSIVYPLLGNVAAAGRTPVELAEALQTALTRFIRDPQVMVERVAR